MPSSRSEVRGQDTTENDDIIAQLLRESTPAYADMFSFSSEVRGQDTQLLPEDISSAAVGRRLSHLSPTPLIPRINESIPTYADAESDHQKLLKRLCDFGLQERRMSGDGNCQFRAISDQLYGTPEEHKSVREDVVNQLEAQRDLYVEYVSMNYPDYVEKMGRQGEWGDHVTLQAAADCFGMKIGLVTSFDYIEITPKTAIKPNEIQIHIFLSFWSEAHYNSLYPP